LENSGNNLENAGIISGYNLKYNDAAGTSNMSITKICI